MSLLDASRWTMRPHRLKADDPHRLRCPRGHTGWEPINGGFWCQACERVTDAKTGEELGREAVRELEREIAANAAAGGGD
jgi:hypothetical protein